MLELIIASSLSEALSPIHKFLLNKWYFDEMYDFLFVRPSKAIGHSLWKVGDAIIVDGGGPNGAAWIVKMFSAGGKIQSGLVYHYALIMLFGVFGLISWFVIKIIFGV